MNRLYTMTFSRAAAAIANCDALLIGAGAGMGVDSGLPDFRGDQGFWKAYPPFQGRRFSEMSNPIWFDRDPTQAWGFFGHRMNLYRGTAPHAGFATLRKWAENAPNGHFVFTSNVDGHFQKAGFDNDRVIECHGSIHFLQCSAVCSRDVWSSADVKVAVDEETIRAASPYPQCRRCEAPSRPNILMFGDYQWLADRFDEQNRRYERWLREIDDKTLVAIEFGAGLAIPTVRYECERRADQLIRVNPRDSEAPDGAISIPLGALDAIGQIDAAMPKR